MSQISSPSSISSASSSGSTKKVVGVPSNNVYTVMLGVTVLLLVSAVVLVFLKYNELYPNTSVSEKFFLTDLKK